MFFESFVLNITVILVLIVALTFDYVTKFFSYWYIRHIPNKTPIPFFGTDYFRIFGIRSNTDQVNALYSQYPKEKFVGSIKSRIPDLIVKDPDAVKTILSTDFADFHCRGLALDKSQDVCLRNNLFYAEGEKWTLLREGLKSVLSNLKCDSEASLHDCLSGTNGDTNVQQLLSKVLDGIFKDLLLDESSDGRVISDMRSTVQKRTFVDRFKTYLKHIFPSLYVMFGLVTMPDKLSSKTKNELEKSKLAEIIKEGSVFQLGLKEKNRSLSDVDFAFAVLSTFITEGYVPCHNLLTAILYDLAKNQQVQKKVRESNEEYLDAVIKESLRLHPPYSVVSRQCMKMYQYPESDLVIDKKITINVPVEAMHRDEKYYKDPKSYAPERFLAETSPTHSFAYLPFGAGPRKCLGEQLSMQISRTVTRAILKRYQLEVCDRTPKELTLADHGFGRAVNRDIWLRFKPISY
ncbi:cytochrome P450 6B1-like [Ostrinia nubilalis]|uniref:cytochrome P450 6B1-like n=1 Tax=Ostrinia nubilalis TaxID=29057 RepID=UPI0030826193